MIDKDKMRFLNKEGTVYELKETRVREVRRSMEQNCPVIYRKNIRFE